MGAHNRDDDPATVLHILRYSFTAVTIATLVIALSLLGVGLSEEIMELWNLGCTMLILAAGGGIVITALYCSEQTQRGLRQAIARLDAVEAGERAIADAFRTPDDEDGDELRRRREG